MSEVVASKRASFEAFGMELRIDVCVKPESWRLSTLLYRGDGEMPRRIKECIAPGGSFKWQTMGPLLHHDADAKALFLIEEIPAAKEYLPFKELIHHFVQVATEWEEMLLDLQ